VAGYLDLVLDRLGQDRRVALRNHLGAGIFQGLEDRRHRTLGIDRHRLARERSQHRLERVAFVDAHAVAQMLANVVADLLGRDEQIGRAVRIDEGEGQSDRRVIDVLAAHVERPGDRIQCRQHRRVGLLLLQPVRHLLPLGRRRPARISIGVDDEPGAGRLGLVGPDGVDRVLADGDQLGALFGQRRARLRHPILGVQPGVVADPARIGRMDTEPVGDAGLGHRLVAPVIAVDLVPDLQRVAPVDEDRGFLRKHDRGAGRALKSGQPGKALGVAPDIFAHMLVGQRHDEPVEAIGLQLLAQRGEAGFICGHKSFPIGWSPAR
jgi:hypothetical protein